MKKTSYDYIIVGGGSAGCVLANRLSENASQQVCLLEAGPRDTSIFISMPMALLMAIRSKVFNWHYWTTPQLHCHDRIMYWPRGKTLGGSSSINAMCYVRGNPHDYNEWENLGNLGWSYEAVFPYFLKMEHFECGKNDYHGIDGPFNVAKAKYLNPLMAVFVEAGKQAGYHVLEDYNAASQEGVGYFYVAAKEGQRCSNARGYLHPIEPIRKNLSVLTNVHVTKILFVDKKAVGVRYQSGQQSIDMYANEEVILAAGAIGTPQLLMVSGVGPQAELEKHHIPLIHALPGVGENLQDHLDIHITHLDKTRTSLSLRFTYLWRAIKGLYDYVWKRDGELTSNYAQAVGFTKSAEVLKAPDLQWHFVPSVYSNSGLTLKPLFQHYGYTLMTCHLHPKSRGRLTLKSANPFDYPLIDAGYLSDPMDLEVLVMGFKKAREILKQKAFALYDAGEYEPGVSVQTDEQIKEYIRSEAQTIYHPVGTCKMGVDPMAVVDPLTLKIYGLENIRIIDASIMPTLPSGNTNAPTTMIAERGAEMILNQAKLKQKDVYEPYSL